MTLTSLVTARLLEERMKPREPRNRAERRAQDKALKRLVKVKGAVSVATKYRVLDANGRDVTAERIKHHDS